MIGDEMNESIKVSYNALFCIPWFAMGPHLRCVPQLRILQVSGTLGIPPWLSECCCSHDLHLYSVKPRMYNMH